MKNGINKFGLVSHLLLEAFVPQEVPFIVHQHAPRSGSEHFDLRFLDPKNPKLLFSFALPNNFPDTIHSKTVCFRTHDHLKRWLDLKSYRLKVFDEGTIIIKIMTSKYLELDFKGDQLIGNYKLFKISTKRDDTWMLVKQK